MRPLTVRFRLDFTTESSLGPGKIALLEQIGRAGSLSQAARDLGMSYRRAWLLLQSINQGFRTPLVTVSTGGQGGGGAALTELGVAVIQAYRSLEQDFQKQAEESFARIAAQGRRGAAAPGLRRRALSRKKLGR